jgi:hypothetical protein
MHSHQPSQHAQLQRSCEYLVQEGALLQECVDDLEDALDDENSNPHSEARVANLINYLETRQGYLTRLQHGLEAELEGVRRDIDTYRGRNEKQEGLRKNVSAILFKLLSFYRYLIYTLASREHSGLTGKP